MSGKLVSVVALGFLFSLSAFAADAVDLNDLTTRDQAFDFIQKNMIGRRLETKIVRKIANDTLFSDFKRVTSFANLQKTQRGFTFDTIVVINQKLWDLDGETKKEPARKKDRDLVVRYEIGQRMSTGELVGYYSILSNSLEDATGNVQSVRMSLKNDILTILADAVLYQDHFGTGDKRTPGASLVINEYSIEVGSLKAKYTESAFSVDPATLQRSPKGLASTSEEIELK